MKHESKVQVLHSPDVVSSYNKVLNRLLLGRLFSSSSQPNTLGVGVGWRVCVCVCVHAHVCVCGGGGCQTQ